VRICSPHCGVDPDTTSGGETYERELLRHVGRRGVEIDLMLARHKRVPADVINWTVHRLPIGRGLRWPIAAVLLPPLIKRVYDARPFDVLRAHSLRFIGPAALMARRRYRLDVPIVVHHHHLDAGWLNPHIERRVIEWSDRTITVSEFSRRQLIDDLGIAPERIDVVANGVDERFAPGVDSSTLRERYGLRGRQVVLFLGGLKTRKNLPFLLDVWQRVATMRPTATLMIAGAGPAAGDLQKRAKQLDLAGRVVFAGRVSEPEKVRYYNLADLFVFPSKLEGFGLAVGEAMSCGLPVVTSDGGALPELVRNGKGGFVCRGDDVEDFTGRLITLLDDANLRRAFGSYNQRLVDECYRWHLAAARVHAIYDDVLARRRRAVAR
jgi:glycosyltransferase involved in cell wall biosynthesis